MKHLILNRKEDLDYAIENNEIDEKLLNSIQQVKIRETPFFKGLFNRYSLKESVSNKEWIKEAIEICKKRKEHNQVLFLKTILFRTTNDLYTQYEHGHSINGIETKDNLRLYPRKLGTLIGGPAYLKKDVRAFIYRDFIEIDMTNSHWNLFCIYCLKKNLTPELWSSIKRLTKEREFILDCIQENDNISRLEAKTLLLQTLYGGGIPSMCSVKSLLKNAQNEIKYIMQETCCSSYSYLSARLQQLEVSLIKDLMNTIAPCCSRMCYVYDGILLKPAQGYKTQDIKNHLDDFIIKQPKEYKEFIKFKFIVPII